VNDLSAFYFDILKDRLYCSETKGMLRRSSQTAISMILESVVQLFAPILSFTAEDIWKYLNKGVKVSVFESNIPAIENKYLDKKLEEKWQKIFELRGEIYKAIEKVRAEKLINHPLESRIDMTAGGEDYKVLKEMEKDMPSILIVSEFLLEKGEKQIKVKRSEGKKCERCWMYLRSVGETKEHPGLCKRCADVVEKLVL